MRYLDNIDIDLTVDLESFAGLPNSKLFFYGLGTQGGSISELAGDVQGVSNIEAENSWRLYEAWFEQIFPKANTSLLLGLYDLNSEFDVIQTGTLFINSSHGIGAAYGNSGALGPSIFPFTSLGARLKISPVEGVTFKAVVLDGIPSDPGNTRGTNIFLRKNDGALVAVEISYTSGTNILEPSNTHAFLASRFQPLDQFRLVLGGWIYTEPRPGWIENRQRDQGLYASAESKLYREGGDPDQGLSGYLRLGLANSKINRFSGYTGLFKSRAQDQLGIAVAIPWSSPDFQTLTRNNESNPADFEMNVEATYLLKVSSFTQLQLDVQYVINPNTLQNIDNAVVLGSRFILSL